MLIYLFLVFYGIYPIRMKLFPHIHTRNSHCPFSGGNRNILACIHRSGFIQIPSSLAEDLEGTMCYHKYCPASSNYDLTENCLLEIPLVEERKRSEDVHFLSVLDCCCFSLANGTDCAGLAVLQKIVILQYCPRLGNL
jgi:hypothetical protein